MSARAWTPGQHPRLFFGPEDIDGLRAKRHSDRIASSAWQRVTANFEEAMALPMPQWSDRWEWDTGSDNQKNLSSVVGDCLRAVAPLGMSWLLDGEKAHAVEHQVPAAESLTVSPAPVPGMVL